MMKKLGMSLLFVLLLMLVAPIMAMPVTININSANAEALASHLKGIGPAKAAAIVEYRKKNGLFAEIEDIVLVKGIGWKTMEANRDNIRLRDKELMQTGRADGDTKGEKSGKSGKDSSTSAKAGGGMKPDS